MGSLTPRHQAELGIEVWQKHGCPHVRAICLRCTSSACRLSSTSRRALIIVLSTKPLSCRGRIVGRCCGAAMPAGDTSHYIREHISFICTFRNISAIFWVLLYLLPSVVVSTAAQGGALPKCRLWRPWETGGAKGLPWRTPGENQAKSPRAVSLQQIPGDFRSWNPRRPWRGCQGTDMSGQSG
jgi:hypothetical protein